jgi:tryptophan synthase beta chain
MKMAVDASATLQSIERPDAAGRFGPYGGRFVPETLIGPLVELETAYASARADGAFRRELAELLRDEVGRPTPLTAAERLSEALGCEILLKREDLCHTGAHKVNNAIGQGLLARRMGKARVVAETGAGQHGVATATAAALFGLDCTIYMGSEDMARQAPNVRRMELLGAEIRSVESGSRTLKDAINESMRDWVTNVRSTHYLLGSALGPHPYPMIVRDFQVVIGEEARAQVLGRTGGLPDVLVACVGGGSNAIGLFTAFLGDPVEMVGVEAGGRSPAVGDHAARFSGEGGAVGVLHGTRTFLLQDEHGNVAPTHSVSAGMDYPAVGPEHALLRDLGRVRYEQVDDRAALAAFERLASLEGILPALESAHALAWVEREAESLRDRRVLVNLSGRGDKDLDILVSSRP